MTLLGQYRGLVCGTNSRNRFWIVAPLCLLLQFMPSVVSAASFSIGLNFTGGTLTDGISLNGGGYAPPDTMGAVGTTQVAEFINGIYAVYDKSTGSPVGSKISDTTFWTTAGLPNPGGLSDPRILFDSASNRWFACEITTAQITGNHILVARSNSADLTAGWSAVDVPVTNGKFADYPTLGLDATGVYVGTNDFTAANAFSSVAVYSIPKADLTAAVPSTANLSRLDNLSANTRGFTIQPVVDFGPAKGYAPLIAVDNQFFSKIDRTNLLGAGGPGATLSSTTVINVASTSFSPLAKQPDGTTQIDTLDDRFSGNVLQVGNVLYMAHVISAAGRSAIRWTKINEATNAVLQEGTISDPNFDFYFPSIAANANGHVVIGFNRSGIGGTDFIGSFAVVGTTDGLGTTTFGAPVLLKAGQANYHRYGGNGERWGDYSSTEIDPSNPNIFWTFQEFAISNSLWGTQITQIIVPEPGSLILFIFGVVGFAVFAWRRTARRAN